jgi:hypothetical protein
MPAIKYKGFELLPAAYNPAAGDPWGLRVVILRHSHDEVRATPYTGDGTYDTEEDAEYHAIEFGKQIVDGRFPELSLP